MNYEGVRNTRKRESRESISDSSFYIHHSSFPYERYVPVREIALHILDIAENSVAAGAHCVEIFVEEDLANDRLRLAIQDDGQGMDETLVAHVTDPFITSRTTRKVGLGIPLLKAAAEASGGNLGIVSRPGQGTRLEVEFQWSHIDRPPLGDLVGTLLTLFVGCPQVHWLLEYRIDPGETNGESQFIFDDAPLKQALEGISLSEPEVLAFIKGLLQEGVTRVQQATNLVEPATP
jgi:hypothetical protein